MADIQLEQRYDEPLKYYLQRLVDKINVVNNVDSRLATAFFVEGLVNGSYNHEEFLKTPPYGMVEVRTKIEGLLKVMENRARMSQTAAIAVADQYRSSRPINKQGHDSRKRITKGDIREVKTSGGTERKERYESELKQSR